MKEELASRYLFCIFELPDIQQRAILPVLMVTMSLVRHKGTGKTATFTIGVLQRIENDLDKTQAIILTHTREVGTPGKTMLRAIFHSRDIKIGLSVEVSQLKRTLNS